MPIIKQCEADQLSLDTPLSATLKKLLEDNEENLKTSDTKYDQGYAEGFHDAIVDVMHAAGIDTDEEYYN